MPHRLRPPLTAPALIGPGLLAVAAGSAWYVLLMQGLWAAEALGPVCGHGLGALHCPGCYGALTTVAFGLAALAGGARRRWVRARASP